MSFQRTSLDRKFFRYLTSFNNIHECFIKFCFQIAIKAIGSEDTPPTIREIISSGLERLLVCEVFAIKDADLIVRVTIEKMKVGSFDEIASFRLILTAIYVCKCNSDL